MLGRLVTLWSSLTTSAGRCSPALLAALAALAALVALATGCGSASTPSGDVASAQTTAHSASTATPRPQPPQLVAPASPAHRTIRVPVLTWHRIVPAGAVGQPDLKVDPAVFQAQLSALQQAGFHSVSEDQLFQALFHGGALPSKPVLLSFDDGYVDDVRTVLPDLQRLHMVASFFVITGRFHEPGFVTEAQTRELDQAGMDVEDHTAHHVDLRLLSPSELTTETSGSRRALQRVLGHYVSSFAYPFGAQNATVRAAVAKAGYALAFTTVGGVEQSTGARLELPRLHIGHTLSASGLIALLGG